VNLRLSVQREVDARLPDVAGTVPDPGDKAGDVLGDRERRHTALVALRAALDVEDVARREAAGLAADRAADAVWLGASLADLATVTSRTRQAARKRWPELGDVHRRRFWLGRQVEGIRWAAGLVVEARPALAATARDGFGDAVTELERSLAEVGERFGLDEPPVGPDPTRRWRALDTLVDVHLRACVDLAGDTDDFAVHGARAVVGYYDHARGQDPG
jgi:hypothetical protein